MVNSSMYYHATANATLPDIPAAARDLHRRTLVLDVHVDIATNLATPMLNPGQWGREQVDLPKMTQGGVDGVFFIVYLPQRNRNAASNARAQLAARERFATIHRMIEQHSARISLATSAQHVRRNAAQAKLSAFIGVENGYTIGGDMGLLAEFRRHGARYMTLTHNGHNDIGDSAIPLPELGDGPEEHGGLSAFGREVIEEMNRLGVLVDVSHAAKKTVLAAVRHSKTPVIASHSGARALVDHPRNLDDEQLDAIAGCGGVVHVTAVETFLQKRPKEYRPAIDAIRRNLGFNEWHAERNAPESLVRLFEQRLLDEIYTRWPIATVGHLVDHIDYIVRRVGIDHVGISSDFDGGGGVQGWRNASETPAVTAELLARGYSEEAIGKIWSGNLLRALDVADARAAVPQGG